MKMDYSILLLRLAINLKWEIERECAGAGDEERERKDDRKERGAKRDRAQAGREEMQRDDNERGDSRRLGPRTGEEYSSHDYLNERGTARERVVLFEQLPCGIQENEREHEADERRRKRREEEDLREKRKHSF